MKINFKKYSIAIQILFFSVNSFSQTIYTTIEGVKTKTKSTFRVISERTSVLTASTKTIAGSMRSSVGEVGVRLDLVEVPQTLGPTLSVGVEVK